MRALLDTNIVIHRENTKATSYSIGKLFYWLDKLHYEKLIHPYTVSELRKYHNPQMQDLYDAKLSAYSLVPIMLLNRPRSIKAFSISSRSSNTLSLLIRYR